VSSGIVDDNTAFTRDDVVLAFRVCHKPLRLFEFGHINLGRGVVVVDVVPLEEAVLSFPLESPCPDNDLSVFVGNSDDCLLLTVVAGVQDFGKVAALLVMEETTCLVCNVKAFILSKGDVVSPSIFFMGNLQIKFLCDCVLFQ
jgi:hypothetical protein